MTGMASPWTLHRLFAIGIFVKGLDGVLELIGGLLFLWVDPRTLYGWVVFLTAHEVTEDPHGVLARLVRHAAVTLSADTHLFVSLYLMAHGVIKVILVAGLWRGVRWVYPAALGVLGVLSAYQLVRLSRTHSLALLVFTLLDLAIIGLVWREYRVGETKP
jgi:uncharacterized membrane protein